MRKRIIGYDFGVQNLLGYGVLRAKDHGSSQGDLEHVHSTQVPGLNPARLLVALPTYQEKYDTAS